MAPRIDEDEARSGVVGASPESGRSPSRVDPFARRDAAWTPGNHGCLRDFHDSPSSRGSALAPADGVYTTCVVNLDAINTIPKRYLKYLMGTLSQAKMDEVKQAILEAFDMK